MKKSLKLFVLILLSVTLIPVKAEVNNFYANDELKINQSINKSTFAAGNNVEISSAIVGSTFVAGNNIFLSSFQDYIFAAGNNINLENTTTRDAFLAGNTINIQSSAIRDLYAIGKDIRIDSDISGDVYAASESITINSKVSGNVKLASDNITIGSDAVISGELEYPEDANINEIEGASIASKKPYHIDNEQEKSKGSFRSAFTAKVYSYISIVIMALICLALIPRFFEKLDEKELSFKEASITTLKGLLILLACPIAAIILMVTIVGFPLGLISLLLYGIMIYLSTITTAYYLGRIGLKDKIKNKYSYIAICILIVFVLRLIPVLGGIVNIISICLGLGLFLELFKKTDAKKVTKKK